MTVLNTGYKILIRPMKTSTVVSETTFQVWTRRLPSMRQTTVAASSLNPSPHTVPQVLLWYTSTRPSCTLEPPTSLTVNTRRTCVDSIQPQRKTYISYLLLRRTCSVSVVVMAYVVTDNSKCRAYLITITQNNHALWLVRPHTAVTRSPDIVGRHCQADVACQSACRATLSAEKPRPKFIDFACNRVVQEFVCRCYHACLQRTCACWRNGAWQLSILSQLIQLIALKLDFINVGILSRCEVWLRTKFDRAAQ